jgi:hypothetical protein
MISYFVHHVGFYVITRYNRLSRVSRGSVLIACIESLTTSGNIQPWYLNQTEKCRIVERCREERLPASLYSCLLPDQSTNGLASSIAKEPGVQNIDVEILSIQNRRTLLNCVLPLLDTLLHDII